MKHGSNTDGRGIERVWNRAVLGGNSGHILDLDWHIPAPFGQIARGKISWRLNFERPASGEAAARDWRFSSSILTRLLNWR